MEALGFSCCLASFQVWGSVPDTVGQGVKALRSFEDAQEQYCLRVSAWTVGQTLSGHRFKKLSHPPHHIPVTGEGLG